VIVALTFGWISITVGVQAQGPASPAPRVSIGTTIPVTRSTHIEITEGNVGVAAALWAEASFYVSSKVSVDFSVEIPASFELRTRHGGSAAYYSTVDHQDFIFMPLVGVRLPSTERLRSFAQFGGGPTLARTSTTFTQLPFQRPPEAGQPVSRHKVVPSLEGGIELAFRLSDRASLVARVHARNTWRRELYSDEVVGGFTLSPGVGIQFQL
jgi:hypothetical protein